MAVTIILFTVSFLSSTVGAVCGIGGGVIIKPVLDAANVMSVSAISLLSGCTVLSMSVISVYKNIRTKTVKFRVRTATCLAIGSAIGGAAGKSIFAALKNVTGNENLAGMIQAAVLVFITLATLLYTIFEKHIITRNNTGQCFCIAIGGVLGVLSGFLGIGGGPVNRMALSAFFSMSVKEAALCSIYIIMFSQTASLVQTIAAGDMPDIEASHFLCMVAGGILGGVLGSRINRKLSEDAVNRLFIILMAVIVGVSVYNAVKFGLA